MYPRYLADQQEVCIAHAAKRAAWVFAILPRIVPSSLVTPSTRVPGGYKIYV